MNIKRLTQCVRAVWFGNHFSHREIQQSAPPSHPTTVASSTFFEQGWLRMSAKIYAGKSSRDFGKAYSRLHRASDNVRAFEPMHPSLCLPEVHSRANAEFNLNIYL